MENCFSLINSAGNNSLELTDIEIRMSYHECIVHNAEFIKHRIKEEKEVYDTMKTALSDKVNLSQEKSDLSSRRIICSFVEDDFSSRGCTSSIHLLTNREVNKIIVYQRSMSSKFFLSDISFFIELCLKYGTDLIVHIGSFHFVL